MAMHRNAKCNWTKIGKDITIKQNNTQVTAATNVSHKKVDLLTFLSGLFKWKDYQRLLTAYENESTAV